MPGNNGRVIPKTRYIVFLYFLFLSAGIYFFINDLYLVQFRENREKEKLLQTQLQQVRAVETFTIAHPQIETYLAEQAKKRQWLRAMLPDTFEISDFVLQVEQAAKAAGVQLIQLRPGSPLSQAGYREMGIEIITKGDFFQTVAFLKKLEDSPRFNMVRALVIQKKSEVLECRFNVVVYFFGEAPLLSPEKQAAKINDK